MLDRITRALVAVNRRVAAKPIQPGTSIVDDLGFDSLRLVDLTLAIEEEFGISDFPMQEWYDAQNALPKERFTVASLIAVCQTCIEQTARAR